ncbi:hypothetical protein V8C34DRAFT_304253 [Trichoderma compactum]
MTHPDIFYEPSEGEKSGLSHDPFKSFYQVALSNLLEQQSPLSNWSAKSTPFWIQGDSLVGHSNIVVGRVVAIHVKGEYITPDGRVDVLKAAPLARLGYHQYTAIREVFDIKLPFIYNDNVSGNTLGGEKGASDAELYTTKDNRPLEEKQQEELEHIQASTIKRNWRQA